MPSKRIFFITTLFIHLVFTLNLYSKPLSEANKNLLYYSVNGYLPGIQDSLKNGANINTRDDTPAFEGETPLMKAVVYGGFDVIRYLTENGADVNAVDERDETALLIASYAGSIKTVRYLIKHGADVNKASKKGYTPLIVASDQGNFEVVKYLLEFGAKINQASKTGFTPLMAAVKNNPILTKYLISKKANVKAKNKSGSTALMLAVSINNEEIIKILLENGTDPAYINKNGRDTISFSIHSAYAHSSSKLSDEEKTDKHYRIFLLLLKYGGNINQVYPDGDSLLHKMIDVINRRFSDSVYKMALYVIDNANNLNHRDKDGFTAYDLSVTMRKEHNLSEKFLKAGAKITLDDEYLHIVEALWKKDYTYVKKNMGKIDIEKFSLLMNKSNYNIKDLFYSEIKVPPEPQNIMYATYICSITDSNKRIKLLQQLMKNTNGDGNQNNMKYVFGSVVEFCSPEDYHVLKPYFKEKGPYGSSLFYSLARYGSKKKLKKLLDLGYNINGQDDRGYTPLMHATTYVTWDHGPEMVKALLEYGADASILNKNGESVFHICIKEKKEREIRSPYSSLKFIKVFYEVFENSYIKIKPNLKYKNGVSLLMLAAEYGFTFTVDTMIAKGSDPNQRDNFGLTALMRAYLNRQTVIVNKLLAAGADPKDLKIFEFIQTNNTEGLKQYLEKYSVHWKILGFARTHEAAPEIMKSLIGTMNLDINRSIVAALFQKGYEEEAKYLIEKGYHPGAVSFVLDDKYYYNYFIENNGVGTAIGRGNFTLLKYLLEKGANPRTITWWGVQKLKYIQDAKIRKLLEYYAKTYEY
ncbi:MAG: ankyrin repeat domain-containing protein [Leptospirales bacterium]